MAVEVIVNLVKFRILKLLKTTYYPQNKLNQLGSAVESKLLLEGEGGGGDASSVLYFSFKHLYRYLLYLPPPPPADSLARGLICNVNHRDYK